MESRCRGFSLRAIRICSPGFPKDDVECTITSFMEHVRRKRSLPRALMTPTLCKTPSITSMQHLRGGQLVFWVNSPKSSALLNNDKKVVTRHPPPPQWCPTGEAWTPTGRGSEPKSAVSDNEHTKENNGSCIYIYGGKHEQRTHEQLLVTKKSNESDTNNRYYNRNIIMVAIVKMTRKG